MSGIVNWLGGLVPLGRYTNQIQRRQAVTVYGIVGLVLVTTVLRLAGIVVSNPEVIFTAEFLIPTMIPLLLTLVPWLLVRQGALRVAVWFVIGLGFFGVFGSAVELARFDSAQILAVTLIILSAVLLLGERGMLLVSLATLVATGAIEFYLANLRNEVVNTPDLLARLVTLVMICGLAYLLAQDRQRSLAYTIEQRNSQRLHLAEISAAVTRRIYRRLDPDSLMQETVDLVKQNFPRIYHAQLFLIDDDRQFAALSASTGEIGKQLMNRQHRLNVGGQSVIGQVTVQGEPVLVSDTTNDPVHRQNELLPNTRTELALPLISDNQIIGALDVQSIEANAFSLEDVNILQTLASQIAGAIDNAQLFTRQQAALAENARLVAQAQAQVKAIEELNKRLTARAWTGYLATQELAPALTVDFDMGARTPNAAWTSGLRAAIEVERPVTQDGDEVQSLALPVKVRGQVIGALEFEMDNERPITAEQIALAQSVVERLGLSVENRRLYEDTERLARREAIINDISANLQTAAGIESAVAVAAQGLQAIMNAPRVAIRLGTPPEVQRAEAGTGPLVYSAFLKAQESGENESAGSPPTNGSGIHSAPNSAPNGAEGGEA